MKIPDKKDIAEENSNSIEFKGSRKKTDHKFLLKFILIAAIISVFAFIWLNAETIFEPFRGIASKIDNKTSFDVGFPIELPGSSEYSIKRFGDNFSLLTDTYLYAYETTGAQIYAQKHGYNKPVQTTNQKRILVFDMSAYSFAVYSKTSLIYQKTLDDKIVYASIGTDNLSAIVTESPKFSNVIYIYDDGGNWKYTKKFADENVMQIAFPGDSEHMIVTTLSVNKGELITNVYCFSIKSTEDHLWKYSFAGNSLPCGIYAGSTSSFIICDNKILSVDNGTGERLGVYSYVGSLSSFDMDDELCAVQYTETSTNRNILMLLDSKAELVAMTNVGLHAFCTKLDKNNVYVLDGMRIRSFSRADLSESSSLTLSEDYSDLVRIADKFFLLGYDNINCIE